MYVSAKQLHSTRSCFFLISQIHFLRNLRMTNNFSSIIVTLFFVLVVVTNSTYSNRLEISHILAQTSLDIFIFYSVFIMDTYFIYIYIYIYIYIIQYKYNININILTESSSCKICFIFVVFDYIVNTIIYIAYCVYNLYPYIVNIVFTVYNF